MNSFSQRYRQQQVIESGFLDLLGNGVDEFEGMKLDAISQALTNTAAKFILTAADNLNAVDRVATGALENSMIASDVIVMGKMMTVSISLNDYYKFLDKGVKGWKSGSPSDSPYAFKAPQPGGAKGKNSQMVAAIKKWLLTEGKKSAGAYERRVAISSRESRRQKITDANTRTAIRVASIIKRKGLEKTNFWTKTQQEIEDFVAKEFETALQIDIVNSITNGTSNK